MFTIGYAKDGSWNETFWDHERFNKLLVEARVELDQTKRRAMYYEMQQILRDEGGAVVPMYMSNVMATSTKIAHGPMAANWEQDGSKCIERWWFA
jgi:peptide/nickel transport system substrate-binding protein